MSQWFKTHAMNHDKPLKLSVSGTCDSSYSQEPWTTEISAEKSSQLGGLLEWVVNCNVTALVCLFTCTCIYSSVGVVLSYWVNWLWACGDWTPCVVGPNLPIPAVAAELLGSRLSFNDSTGSAQFNYTPHYWLPANKAILNLALTNHWKWNWVVLFVALWACIKFVCLPSFKAVL